VSLIPAIQVTPARQFYLDTMAVLDRHQVPYLIGGGYAMAFYTGIVRDTKDLDLFLRAADVERALDVLSAEGLRTERTWPPFLAKVLADNAFVDLLHNSGNGLCPVDDQWFAYGIVADVLGRQTLLCPPEEVLWSKGFVQERDRFDGADIAHLILAQGHRFDWHRLVGRFDQHYRVLLGHLVFFGYIYPAYRSIVPDWVIAQLLQRIAEEAAIYEPLCNGTLLAHRQYRTDVQEWGFLDARLRPHGPFTPQQLEQLPDP